MMDVSKRKLGLTGEGKIEIMNVKCDKESVLFLLDEPGCFPAYHMNKASWVSVALDGVVEGEKIKILLKNSYEMTK